MLAGLVSEFYQDILMQILSTHTKNRFASIVCVHVENFSQNEYIAVHQRA